MTTNEWLNGGDAPAPGGTFRSPGRTITEADLVSFSALTGDWHPQHSDAEWSKASRFSQRIAHGMLVLSYSIGLAPLDPERVVALRGLDSVAFKRPVFIGDTIRVEGEVESVKPLDPQVRLVGIRWRILNQDDRVVARALVQALWRTGSTSTDEAASRNGADERPARGSGQRELYGDRILL
jgi:3-hydroxybutyryl-CoA dehydratase